MKRSRVRRPLALVTASIFAGLLVTGVLAAHDFWIVPDAFQIASGGTLEVRGQTGSRFPASQSATTPDRVAEARLVGASTDDRITDFSVSDKSLLIRHKPATPGQRIVAVALVSRSTRTTPERLKRYIALEGNPDLAERYEREGAYPKVDSLTQVSAKFAKTIVEVGRGPRTFARAVGHVLEFVPVNDPADLHAGDSLAVRLLFHGQPVAGAHLRAGAGPTSDTVRSGEAPAKDLTVVTGPDGVAKVPLDRAGLWNARTLYAAASSGNASAWEVPFATLVFSVGAAMETPRRSIESGGEVVLEHPPRHVAATDSADVAAVVLRYDAALAASDSAAAVALLAPDAIILEGGVIETREEYMSGHLAADIRAARSRSSTTGAIRVVVRGDVAWASSASTRKSTSSGPQVISSGAELMVLSRESGGWKIRAIHWSSRSQRTPRG